jgi:archaellum component FlaF (FlaF/FlaG flagellin family)
MKKGISEIIAILVMLLIVSSIGVIIYTYATGYFSLMSSAITERSKLDINTIKEKFVIVDVIINRLSNSTEICTAVYNYGKTSIILKLMFINGTKAITNEEEILPGEFKWFNGTINIVIPSNTIINLKVVSSLGNYYETVIFQ